MPSRLRRLGTPAPACTRAGRQTAPAASAVSIFKLRAATRPSPSGPFAAPRFRATEPSGRPARAEGPGPASRRGRDRQRRGRGRGRDGTERQEQYDERGRGRPSTARQAASRSRIGISKTAGFGRKGGIRPCRARLGRAGHSRNHCNVECGPRAAEPAGRATMTSGCPARAPSAPSCRRRARPFERLAGTRDSERGGPSVHEQQEQYIINPLK